MLNRYYDSSIGRWINADDQISDVGGDIRGYNQFSYCFNNPISLDDQNGCFPHKIKNVVKQVAKNIVRPAVKAVEKGLSKIKATYSLGVNISATPSMWILNGQIGISVDARGNVALQASGGGGATTGTSSFSLSVYQSVTNAPSIYELTEQSYLVGGSIGAPIKGFPFYTGVDIMFMDNDKLYHGFTSTTGGGTPGLEVHAEWGKTITVEKAEFNIFDVARLMYRKVMEW